MDLFVIRHGPAVDRAALGPDEPDAARPLTPKGRRRVQRITGALQALGVDFERLWFSPWRRAVETAEELTPLVRGELAVTALLAAPPSAALYASLTLEREALVGHEPWLGELIGTLAFGDALQGEHLRLTKGGVAHLEGLPHPGGMRLVALWPARTLARLGGHPES